jgi:hypothetical protein
VLHAGSKAGFDMAVGSWYPGCSAMRFVQIIEWVGMIFHRFEGLGDKQATKF